MWLTRREALTLGTAALAGTSARVLGLQSSRPDVELELTASPASARILPGRATDVWRFTGRVIKGPASALQPVPESYLGPTIRVTRGQRVRIHFRNQLPDPSIVHWHGLDVPEAADGHPRLAVAGGRTYVYDFEVVNRAGTYWYHPHPHMQTGPQVYSGLAGMLIVSDDVEAALPLPSGHQDLVAVIQDRRFDANNQLVYPTAMMDREIGVLGDRILVNGRPSPTWALATRAYRLRLLNGSNARIYKLRWNDGTPMTILGTDGGLLERPLTQPAVTLAPAQRVDVWIDLSARAVGTTLALQSAGFPVSDAGLDMGSTMGGRMSGLMGGRGGAMGGSAGLALGAPMTLLTLAVGRREKGLADLPASLSTFDASWAAAPEAPVRRVPLTFRMMEWFMAGRAFSATDMTEVAPEETVAAGSTQAWEFVNSGGPMGQQMAHPLHLHGRQFRVVRREGSAPTNALREGLVDAGWMDTVLVLPYESVRIQIPFSTFRGLFLYHCHILEHEDMGMMRNFRIV